MSEHGYNIEGGKNKIGFATDLKDGIKKGRAATMKRFKIISKTNRNATPGFTLFEISNRVIDGKKKEISYGEYYKEKYMPTLKKFVKAKIA